jgi:hypothetical protein
MTGIALSGRLWTPIDNQPLSTIFTLASMGIGLPYFVARFIGYTGDMLSASFEYGSAFVVTGGVMNLLLVLDAWDITLGKKE